MAKSTFQKPPQKILVSALTTTTINDALDADGNVVITVGGQIIKFKKTEIVSATATAPCTDDGTKQTAAIVLVLDSTCDCVQCFDIKVVKIGGLSRRVSDTYASTRTYRSCIPKGVTISNANMDTYIGTPLAQQINADKDSPVTASYNTGTDTLTLTSKTNGVMQFTVASQAGTVTLTPGTADVLTADDILKLFPIPLDTLGGRPRSGICLSCACQYNIKVRINEGNDPIEGGGEFTENEYQFYVNCDDANFDDYWDTKWDSGAFGPIS